MNYMAMAGWKTNDMLSGIEGIMNLAAASGEDLASTSDIVTDALTAFGLSASDSGHFADILAAASSNANTNVSMMGETFKYAAPVLGSLGYSAEDSAIAIGLMANAGIKSSQAGTALRSAITNLAKPTDTVASAMEQYGISLTDSSGKMYSLRELMEQLRQKLGGLSEAEQAQAAASLFGKEAMSGMLAIINGSPADFEKLSNAIDTCSDTVDGYNGTTEKMAAVMQDNLAGQVTILKSQLEELAISFSDILMPTIRSIVSRIQELVDKLNQLDPQTKETIAKIALIAAALGPMLVVLGKTISGVGTVFSAVSKLPALFSAVQSGIGAITGALGVSLGPLLAIIAAVAALVAAFVHLWKTNDEFRENILATWTQIKETVSGFCQGIVDRLNSLGFEFESITEVLSTVWQGFCSLLAPIFEGVFQHIADTLSTVLDVILGIVDVFIGLFTGNWEQLWTGVKEVFGGVWDFICNTFSNYLNVIQSVADVVLGWFGTSWEEVWTSVSATFTNIWNGITGFLADAWETIKNVVSVGIQFIGSLLEAAWDIITLPFQLIWQNCGDTITSIWESIKTTVGNAIHAVSTTLSTVMSAIQTTVGTIWSAISAKISAVVNGVKTTVSTVFNAIKATASTIWNGIKTAISTVVDGVKTKVTTVFNSVKTTLSSVFTGIRSTAASVWNGIKNAITAPIDAAKTHVSNALGSIKRFFANCKLSLPHIKLPHFSISGSFSLNPPRVPRLSISWYKEGGIMTDPTLFGFNGSSLMAGGEAGPEAILPLKSFYTKLEAMLDSKLNMSGMERYLAVIARNSEKGIYLDGGTLVGKLAPGLNRQLGILAAQEVYR